MSYVIAVPEVMTSAATDFANICSTLTVANAAAAVPTTGILAAAEDEVSAAIAALFSGHGQAYQGLGAQASAFHAQFVHALSASTGAYNARRGRQRVAVAKRRAQSAQRGQCAYRVAVGAPADG